MVPEGAVSTCFGGFALVYLVFLTATQATTELLPLGGRHLSPVYIPLLFAAVFALDKVFGSRQVPEAMQTGGLRVIGTIVRWRADKAVPLALAVRLILLLWLSAGAALNVRDIRQNNEGIGMGMATALVNSETLWYIAEYLLRTGYSAMRYPPYISGPTMRTITLSIPI